MHCCQDKVNPFQNIPSIWQVISAGLPVERFVAQRVRHGAQGALIGLIRLHVQLTGKAITKWRRMCHPDAEFRALRSALRVIEAEAMEGYGFVLALIARDAVEAEAAKAGGCCRCHDASAHDASVAEAIGRVVGASMFAELNIHGRCPPCRDARAHQCGRVAS